MEDELVHGRLDRISRRRRELPVPFADDLFITTNTKCLETKSLVSLGHGSSRIAYLRYVSYGNRGSRFSRRSDVTLSSSLPRKETTFVAVVACGILAGMALAALHPPQHYYYPTHHRHARTESFTFCFTTLFPSFFPMDPAIPPVWGITTTISCVLITPPQLQSNKSAIEDLIRHAHPDVPSLPLATRQVFHKETVAIRKHCLSPSFPLPV